MSEWLVCERCEKRVKRADAIAFETKVLPGDLETFIQLCEKETGERMPRLPQDSDPALYYKRTVTRGVSRKGFYGGTWQEHITCGPLRELTPTDECEDQLEAAFGKLS